MSGDVQPRKRKEKKRRRDDEDAPPKVAHSAAPSPSQKASRSASAVGDDIELHVQHDHGTGGHWCAKIVFFALMAILVGLVGLIVLENRGNSDLDTPLSESRFADYLEGWVDEVREDDHHDDQHSVLESLHELDEHEHDDEPFSEEEVAEDDDNGDDDEHGDGHDDDDGDDDEGEGEEEEEGEEDDDAENDDDDASEEPEVEASDEAAAADDEDDNADDDDDNAASLEGDQPDDEDDEDNDDNGKDDEDNNDNTEEADEDDDADGKDVSTPASLENSKLSADDGDDDDGDDDNDPFDENSTASPSTLKAQVDEVVERFNRLAKMMDMPPFEEPSVKQEDDDGDDDDDEEPSVEKVTDNDVGEDLHLQKLAQKDDVSAADDDDDQTAEKSSYGDDGDECVEDDAATTDEPPAGGRRMTLIEGGDDDADDDRHSDAEHLDNDGEEYEGDEGDDYYERYSDEEEPELLASDKDAAEHDYTFERMQAQYGRSQVFTPTTSDSDGADAVIAAQQFEKRQTVKFAAEPLAATDAAGDCNEHAVADYEHIEHDANGDAVVDDGEYGAEYEDEEFDGDEYDDEEVEEEEEEEEDEEEDVSDIDDAELMQRLDSKYGKLPETTTEQSDEDDDVVAVAVLPRSTFTTKTSPSGGGQSYSANLEEELRRANQLLEDHPASALKHFEVLLTRTPLAAHYGRAKALDLLAEQRKDNALLDQAIAAYSTLITEFEPSMSDERLLAYGTRCVELMRFKGQNLKAIPIHERLIDRFNDTADQRNALAVTLLLVNRLADAKLVLHQTLLRWRNDGFAAAHYGFVLKSHDNDLPGAAQFLREGIDSGAPGTDDGRLYLALGDTLQRLRRDAEARTVFQRGAQLGLFRSEYQRSLYNVDRLAARPLWTAVETGAASAAQLAVLAQNWLAIRAEAERLLVPGGDQFIAETEMLRDRGDWRQFELFARGRRVAANCARAPLTCKIIDGFAAARTCTRGQVKFSVMQPDTHVWPHCGPTNCRLRAHLGLRVPRGTFLRVASQWRQWHEGEWLIFDDSFEHEVWHNGTSARLVLIVDIWHPELTEHERRTLHPI